MNLRASFCGMAGGLPALLGFCLVGCGDFAEPLEAPLGSVSEPLTLATGVRPTSLALDGTNVYFTNAKDIMNAKIAKVPLGGGAVTSLWNSTLVPSSIAERDGQLYWSVKNPSLNPAGLYTFPISGGTPTVLVSKNNDLEQPQAVLVRGSGSGPTADVHVYYANAYYSQVFDVHLVGGTTTTTELLPPHLPMSPAFYYPYGLVSTSTTLVFVNDTGDLYTVPKTGGTPTLQTTGTERQAIAQDGTYVYFVKNGDIRKRPIAGGSGTLFSSTVGTVSDMQVNGGDLYWTCSSCGTLMKQSLTASTPTTLVSGLTNPQCLAVGSTHVYFGTDNALKRTLK